MELKLGNFEFAAKLEFEGQRRKTICGTPNYIAPEILDGKVGYSYEVDIWSLGIIFYALIYGKPPFETPDVKNTYKKILKNDFSFIQNVPISESAKDLITKMLDSDPLKRPTVEEITNHPFVTHDLIPDENLPLDNVSSAPSVDD